MKGFYKLYPGEIYAVNDIMPDSHQGERPFRLLFTFDFRNRCVNYNAVAYERRRFDDDVLQNILTVINLKWSFISRFVWAYFPHKAAEILRSLDQMRERQPRTLDDQEKAELHYQLINLYHYFPNHPHKYLDGILRKVETQLALDGRKLRFVKVDFLSRQACPFERLPWVRLQVFGPGREFMPLDIQIRQDGKAESHEMTSQVVIANQEDLSFFAQCPGTRAGLAGVDEVETDEADDSAFFYQYLFPFFSDPDFSGAGFRTDIEEIPVWNSIVVPIYSADLIEEPCGQIIGHLMLPFSNQRKRDAFMQEMVKDPELMRRWEREASLIAQTLQDGRAQSIAAQPVQDSDVVKDVLAHLTELQDWERVMVFDGQKNMTPKYCWKRSPRRGSAGGWFSEDWLCCEGGEQCAISCTDSFPAGLGGEAAALTDSSSQVVHAPGKAIIDNSLGRSYYLLHFGSLLDSKILPASDESLILSHGQTVLCFEFPSHTFFPRSNSGFEAGVQRLGEHFLKQIIPILDQRILKSKVLQHSVKSAVAAVISRNHSHHIGSHVTPRTSVGKIVSRFHELGCRIPEEHHLEIIGDLKGCLDEYIQKKADFLAEISTEPLATTKTAGLMNEVMVPFITNTLLMDNIGANEGLRYSSGLTPESRIKLHVYADGRELHAAFHGGQSCSCGFFHHTGYPFPSRCSCNSPRQLSLAKPEQDDVFLAFPGPLGEFALYCFLENVLRNTIKHNHSKFKGASSPEVNLHINVMDTGQEWYTVRIWEDVTCFDQDLQQYLQRILAEPIVDDVGRLRKGAWGIAEMKIMATLMVGADDFSAMESSLRISGDDALIYEFKAMKPKEVAIVSRRGANTPEFKKKGVWWFSSLDEYVLQQQRGLSKATFEICILDRDCEEIGSRNEHLLPFRVLSHTDNPSRPAGSVAAGEAVFKRLLNQSPDGILTCAWEHWVQGFQSRIKPDGSTRVCLFFAQEKDEQPSSGWLKQSKKREDAVSGLKSSIVHMGEEDNYVEPEVAAHETVLMFDRHFAGCEALPNLSSLSFHEAFDKNSLDFAPIFSAQADDLMLLKLAESGLLSIAVLDERVAEVSKDPVMAGEGKKAHRLYGALTRIMAWKWANVHIVTHIQYGSNDLTPLHQSVEDSSPRFVLQMRPKPGQQTDIADIRFFGYDHSAHESEIHPQAMIIHQGMLERICKELVAQGMVHVGLQDILQLVRSAVPYVVVDSGRGIPSNLPPDIKFLPFSLIEETLMKDRISKYRLTSVIMRLTRRGL